MVGHALPPCRCVADHNPEPLDGEVHHIWPKGMGGPDVNENVVFLCPTAHTNAHEILRLMVKDLKYLSYRDVHELLQKPVNRYAFQIALLGYRRWVNHSLA